MITQVQILDAINDLTADCFPGRVTYRDAWPEQFERPSLFLVAEKKEIIGGNRCTVEYRQVFGVQINDTVDAHYEADTDRLSTETDQVVLALAEGVLHTGDRALHIDKVETAREGAAAIVKMTLHWFDDRPVRQGAQPPIARGVEVTTEIKNNGGGTA